MIQITASSDTPKADWSRRKIFVLNRSKEPEGFVDTVHMVCTVALNPAFGWAQEGRSLAALVSRVAQGDEDCLAQLYDCTNRIVYGLALRILGDPTSAEDITPEVYMQVWRTAESYDAGRGTVEAWLVTLARSRAIDWLRSRRARSQEVVVRRRGLGLNAGSRSLPL